MQLQFFFHTEFKRGVANQHDLTERALGIGLHTSLNDSLINRTSRQLDKKLTWATLCAIALERVAPAVSVGRTPSSAGIE